MSFARNYRSQGGTTGEEYWPTLGRNDFKNFHNFNHRNNNNWNRSRTSSFAKNYNNFPNFQNYMGGYKEHADNSNYFKPDSAPSFKRRKFSDSTWGDGGRHYLPPNTYEFVSSTCNNYLPYARSNGDASASTTGKRDRSKLDEDELPFMSRDEIERCSPSRKDGIDSVREAHLRYSYCSYLQNLGLRLDLPQTTIATAMVLCHRFFSRRSHACHDRFLIATAALFLAAKSEETPRPLNTVLRMSSEISHKQDISFLSYMLPIDWFEQYRERVTEAEQMILTTLNFELGVQHPYAPLTSILNKLGLSQTVLVNLSLSLVSEGLRSSLWLQFKPHHIAAGAAYLAAKFLNLDLDSYKNIWQEFQATPDILQAVAQQLMELF
ncbi:cyclin-T1-4-like isoform X3 [Malus sylvestris]|uniref:cyclin-T1-4-like isoform X3 n=1 Tax=Malus sylvestris TaxID=3752 RepID=UPI0021AC2969|nr:cyclin-T1-4-like isoform X3 [Malus sylvestris]